MYLYKSQIVFVKPRWEDSQWNIGTGWREVENRVDEEQLFKSQVARSYIFPSYTITLTNRGITMSTKTEWYLHHICRIFLCICTLLNKNLPIPIWKRWKPRLLESWTCWFLSHTLLYLLKLENVFVQITNCICEISLLESWKCWLLSLTLPRSTSATPLARLEISYLLECLQIS